MRSLRSRRLPIALAVALFTVLVVPAAFAATPAASAAPAVAAAPAATAAVLTQCSASADVLADMGLPSPLLEAVTPHCCSQQQIDACRSGCKDVGPGCKGQIACRAGECDCTCVCP